MEQLTFLNELHDLRGERKRPRRAQRAPREAAQPCGAEPGQRVFDFEGALERPAAARVVALPTARRAHEWYEIGCELERGDRERARTAYERSLALAPAHADAHLNLGCLDHEAGRLADAERHYRAALAARAGDVT